MNHRITDVYELLRREASMSAQLLGTGLTSIRKYNFASKGLFYSGMFSICIGIERILKLIVLLDYRLKNNSYPENAFLRNKSHKIKDLIKDCKAINDDLCGSSKLTNSLNTFEDILVRKIVNFLTQFAMDSRYYNLDVVTGVTKNSNEPLAHWDSEICSIILKRHPPSKRKVEEYKNIADTIGDISLVHHIHENGTRISNTNNLFQQSSYIEEKQGYSVYYIYKIVDFSVQLLQEIDSKLVPQLFLREHFIHLYMYNPTCSSIRRRKNWTLT